MVNPSKKMPNTLVDPGMGTTMPKAALETDYSKFGKVLFTVRNEVAKVMFLQACVCPRGGGT